MSKRVWACLTIAVALSVVSPALLALGGVQAGDISIVQWWFFGIPQQVEAMLGVSRGMRLPLYLACYTFQFFTVLYVAATLAWEIQRPRGIEARKAFEEAVTRFHDE